MRLCAICKQEIHPERVEALPATRLCTRHGEQIKQFGDEFKMTAVQDRTSKQGSLKLNYGGIATTQVRNELAFEMLRDAYEAEQFEDNPTSEEG